MYENATFANTLGVPVLGSELFLPRPAFNLASGTSLFTSIQEDDETSPVFPRRVEIIQSSGFEKPKLSCRKHPDRSNNWILAGVRGGSRDPYLSVGL